MRALFFAALLAVALPVAASAQDLTVQQRATCRADYDKFCKGVLPGANRLIICLDRYRAGLSDACKKVIDVARTKL